VETSEIELAMKVLDSDGKLHCLNPIQWDSF
jgi:hypothetical protein